MVTKGYGLTPHDIDMSCPADLEPYEKAYMLEQKNKDSQMWAWWGSYGVSATLVAVEHCLAGQKAKTKYVEKPLLNSEYQENNGYKESHEECARYEMEQRINLLRQSGLPEGPD